MRKPTEWTWQSTSLDRIASLKIDEFHARTSICSWKIFRQFIDGRICLMCVELQRSNDGDKPLTRSNVMSSIGRSPQRMIYSMWWLVYDLPKVQRSLNRSQSESSLQLSKHIGKVHFPIAFTLSQFAAERFNESKSNWSIERGKQWKQERDRELDFMNEFDSNSWPSGLIVCVCECVANASV